MLQRAVMNGTLEHSFAQPKILKNFRELYGATNKTQYGNLCNIYKKENIMRSWMSVFACLTLSILGPSAWGRAFYLTSFENTYPAARNSRIDNCSLCHLPNQARNDYGYAFSHAGHEFVGIESADSDGDGFTNLEEINALSFPGDDGDEPEEGAVRVTLEPQGARDAGAQWRLGPGGEWQGSGITLPSVGVGAQTIQFKPVTGWIVPPDQQIAVLEEKTFVVTGTYTRAQATVPDVVGQTQAAAATAVAGAGLVIGTVTQEYSATVPAGLVTGQTPSANAGADAGSVVSLVLSRGPQPGPVPVPVPDVAGLTRDAASAAIEAAGLAVGQVNEAPNDTVPAGAVVSQVPAAGTLAESASPVDLIISSGPHGAGCACPGAEKKTLSLEGGMQILGDILVLGLSLTTLRLTARGGI
jgi:hypothetical protein